MPKPIVLIVDDDMMSAQYYSEAIEDCGVPAAIALTFTEAVNVLCLNDSIRLVLCDYFLDGNETGEDLAVWVQDHCSERIRFAFLTLCGNVEFAELRRLEVLCKANVSPKKLADYVCESLRFEG